MKSWMIVLTLVVVLALGGLAYSMLADGTPVESAVAKRGPIAEFVSERGKTRLPKTYLITMPYAARIEAINIREGDKVSEGQVVARVVPRDLELELKVATESVNRLKAAVLEKQDVSVETTLYKQTLNYEAAMEKTVDAARDRRRASEAKLQYAEERLQNVEAALRANPNAITPDEYQSTRVRKIEADVDRTQDEFIVAISEALYRATDMADVLVTNYITRKTGPEKAVLEEELNEAQARLEQVEQKVSRGEMTSPVTGLVLERKVDNERYLPGGEVLLEIGDLRSMEIEAEILTQDAVHIHSGNEVEIYGPSIGPEPVRGVISQIYPAGFTKVSSLGVEQQRVRVIVALPSQVLEPLIDKRGLGVNYRVRVKIFTAEKADALTIPRSALFRGHAGDWQVFAVRDGHAQLQNVEVGLMNDETVEIISGIEEGTPVVLAPETSLADGDKVSLVQTGGVAGGSNNNGND